MSTTFDPGSGHVETARRASGNRMNTDYSQVVKKPKKAVRKTAKAKGRKK